MKIALLTDGIYPYVIGGMQKHSYYLAKYLSLNGITVDLYHTSLYNTATEAMKLLDCFSAVEKKNINSILIDFPKYKKLPGHYLRESYAYSKALYNKLMERPSVDFIYVQGLCGMKLLENKHLVKTPIGINFHGLNMFQQAADLKTKLQHYLFKYSVLKSLNAADTVFSLGGKLTGILLEQGISKNKICELPIGIDSEWVKQDMLRIHTPRKFIFIGRYERVKGIEELSEAILLLIQKHDFYFDFIGGIPENKQIKSEKIKYHGAITDAMKIKECLFNTDVLVCPSYSEGMPTVILEAMASGLAIIATDVGAVAEQVNKQNGLLIQPGDINSLCEAITHFIKMNDEELLSMKEQSIIKVKQKFLWDRVIAQTIEAINQMITV